MLSLNHVDVHGFCGNYENWKSLAISPSVLPVMNTSHFLMTSDVRAVEIQLGPCSIL